MNNVKIETGSGEGEELGRTVDLTGRYRATCQSCHWSSLWRESAVVIQMVGDRHVCIRDVHNVVDSL